MLRGVYAFPWLIECSQHEDTQHREEEKQKDKGANPLPARPAATPSNEAIPVSDNDAKRETTPAPSSFTFPQTPFTFIPLGTERQSEFPQY